jgi:hypothetical protein
MIFIVAIEPSLMPFLESRALPLLVGVGINAYSLEAWKCQKKNIS